MERDTRRSIATAICTRHSRQIRECMCRHGHVLSTKPTSHMSNPVSSHYRARNIRDFLVKADCHATQRNKEGRLSLVHTSPSPSSIIRLRYHGDPLEPSQLEDQSQPLPSPSPRSDGHLKNISRRRRRRREGLHQALRLRRGLSVTDVQYFTEKYKSGLNHWFLPVHRVCCVWK